MDGWLLNGSSSHKGHSVPEHLYRNGTLLLCKKTKSKNINKHFSQNNVVYASLSQKKLDSKNVSDFVEM